MKKTIQIKKVRALVNKLRIKIFLRQGEFKDYSSYKATIRDVEETFRNVRLKNDR